MALKIASRKSVLQEIEMRQGLDPQWVLPVLRVHTPAHITLSDELRGGCDAYGVEHASQPSDSDEWVLVMQWADTTLSDELLRKHIAGVDALEVQHILRDVAQSLNHLHAEG